MKTAVIMGTRPEIIKLAPIIENLSKKNTHVIFTGQHFDYHMGLKFIEQLGICKPDFSLKIARSIPEIQMGQIILKLSKILRKIQPDSVVVQGDTNTVLAASICALKSEIPICHVESGLRSFDWRMPEEHNRIATDHISELLFAPTQLSKNNLLQENVHGKIFVTGNTVIDSINKYSKISAKRAEFSVEKNDFILMTFHRAENVDNKKILSSIIKVMLDSNYDIIFPAHPRTLKRLHEFNLYNKIKNSENILLLNSLGYFEMLELMKKCSFIVTDSGGIQEEATSPKIRKKVLVIRKTTDRPEAVKSGLAELVGVTPSKIKSALNRTINNPKITTKKTPYGDGHSAQKIVKIMKRYF